MYGYAPIEGTGTPETPAKASSSTIKDLPVQLNKPGEGPKPLPAWVKPDKWSITIAGLTFETSVTSENDFEDAINDWITAVGKEKPQVDDGTGKLIDNEKLVADGKLLDFSQVTISLDVILIVRQLQLKRRLQVLRRMEAFLINSEKH